MMRHAIRVCAIAAIYLMSIVSIVNAFGQNTAQTPLRAAGVLSDIKAHGPRAVADHLWADRSRWNQVMARIGDGAPGWLEVAVALRPGTDGGAAELLDEAVFFALKPEPVAVLKLLKARQFDSEFVCSSNVGTDYPAEKSRQFVQDRIEVLSRVSDPTVRSIRERCLTGLQSALSDLANSDTGAKQ